MGLSLVWGPIADRFGRSRALAATIFVQTAAATWREEANRLQISKAEQDRMAAAFEHS
jgi:MFS family permease